MSPEGRDDPEAGVGAPRDLEAPAEDPSSVEEGARAGDDAARAALERARAAVRGGYPGRGRPAGPRRRSDRSGRSDGSAGDRSNEPFAAGRDPVALASSLGGLLAERGWERPLSVASVVGRWREVVGSDLADHCRPETFEDGALVVRADSTAWAMQVRLLLPQLERRLAEEVGEGVVESVTVLGPGGPTWRRGPRSVPGRGPRDTYG